MRIVVAIHDLPVWSIPPAESRRIAEILDGDEVVDVRDDSSRLAALGSADIVFTARLSAAECAAAAPLAWVHTPSVGVGGILTDCLVDRPVIVSNSRGVHSEAIAEHALALMLALRRGLLTAARRQQEHRWAQAEMAHDRQPALSETTLLVAGLGTIGARVARWGADLGMRVIGLRRRTDQPVPAGVTRVIGTAELDDALGEADVVVLTLPGTRETRNLIGAEQLARMKPSAFLVNVARGELVDEAALVRALAERRLAGAGLDVFREEPLPPAHALWDRPDVLVSPHAAAFAGAFWPPIVDLFLQNVTRFRQGLPLMNSVDKRAGY